VISNLLSNAIKFTDEGTVSITAVPNNDEIVVSIIQSISDKTAFSLMQVHIYHGMVY
jgi:K+-sensing histidine kinase KdpD